MNTDKLYYAQEFPVDWKSRWEYHCWNKQWDLMVNKERDRGHMPDTIYMSPRQLEGYKKALNGLK